MACHPAYVKEDILFITHMQQPTPLEIFVIAYAD